MSKIIVSLILTLFLLGCSQQRNYETLADLENHYKDLNQLNNDLEDQRNHLFQMIREYNSRHIESEQFDIASIDTIMGLPERDLLRAMFKEEKDISYNGLLSNIISKNEEIRVLNDKITELGDQIVELEGKLPKAYVVQKGDTHYKIVRDFLVNEYGLQRAQAKELAWKTSMTDNLLPGNKIWLSYDKEQDMIGTFVTQGDAKIAPMRFEQIAKRNMIKNAVDKALEHERSLKIQQSDIESTRASL